MSKLENSFPPQFLSISAVKENYMKNYSKYEFKDFLRQSIKELSFGLKVNLELIEKDLEDEAMIKAGVYGAIDSLKRVLLPLAETVGAKTIKHPDYAILAGRLELHRIMMYIPETLEKMYSEIPQVFVPEYLKFCVQNKEQLENMINPELDYYYTFFGIQTLEKTYLIKFGENQFYETPQRLYLRKASFLHYDNLEKIKEYYDLFSLGYFTHSTPTLANAGIVKGSLASCFLLSIEDSLSRIFDCLKSCALISKHMGGIGLDVTNIRHSKIGNFGMSNGIVPMLKVFDDAMRYADQGGGKRKGSATIFLQPWHVDFPDFLELKRPQGKEERRARDLFYSVWSCDLFMDRVKNNQIWSLFCPKKAIGLTECYGEEFEKLYEKYENEKLYEKQVDARTLWNELISSQIETGMPFITHRDTANFTSNQKNLGLIRSSNLCVSGDTYILTRNGQVQIARLEDEMVEVWNGKEWSETTVRCTSNVPTKLLTVNLSDGSSLNCTPEHKFYIKDSDGVLIKTDAQELNIGDILIDFKLPNASEITVSRDCFSDNLLEKLMNMSRLKFVPLDSSNAFKIKWLNNILKTSRYSNGNHYIIGEKGFLLNIRLMLQTMGVFSKISYNNTFYNNLLWTLGFGTKNYELMIHSSFLGKLVSQGLDQNYLTKVYDKYDKTVKVVSVEDNNIREKTYCFTESKRGMGVFNGILTGQCQEIVEVTDNNTVSSCNLASIALNKYVNNRVYDFDKLGYVTRKAIRSLNEVLDRTFYPLTEKDNDGPIKSTNLRYRPLGLGVQGLADTFMAMGYSWEDPEARELNRQIFACIYYNSLVESCKLAQEQGSSAIDGAYDGFEGSPASQGYLKFDLMAIEYVRKKFRGKNYSKEEFDFEVKKILKDKLVSNYDWDILKSEIKKHGLRNSLLIALMPTASTAQIRDNIESFEPISSNLYERSVLAGKHIVANNFMVNEFTKLGIWNESVRNFIIMNEGSVQKLPLELVSEDKRDYFLKLKNMLKTAFELKQKIILDFSIDRSYYVCQSQSLNIHIQNPTFAQLGSLHFYAWENCLTTGMYYLRTKPATNAIKFTVEGEIDVKRNIVCTEEVCLSCGS